MSRLFITGREIRFIADINRELIKDVCGQVINVYPISEIKTVTGDVYNEALQKVYDNPINVDALVEASFHEGTRGNEFGIDNEYKVDVYVQWRDLVEKGIEISVGDYFSYDSVMYEVADRSFIKTIYGQAEHKEGVKFSGVRVRRSQFDAPIHGPTDVSFSDADAVQERFDQQRGQDTGVTGDVRELVRDGVLEDPLGGPKEVSHRGDAAGKTWSFYGDDE